MSSYSHHITPWVSLLLTCTCIHIFVQKREQPRNEFSFLDRSDFNRMRKKSIILKFLTHFFTINSNYLPESDSQQKELVHIYQGLPQTFTLTWTTFKCFLKLDQFWGTPSQNSFTIINIVIEIYTLRKLGYHFFKKNINQ